MKGLSEFFGKNDRNFGWYFVNKDSFFWLVMNFEEIGMIFEFSLFRWIKNWNEFFNIVILISKNNIVLSLHKNRKIFEWQE